MFKRAFWPPDRDIPWARQIEDKQYVCSRWDSTNLLPHLRHITMRQHSETKTSNSGQHYKAQEYIQNLLRDKTRVSNCSPVTIRIKGPSKTDILSDRRILHRPLVEIETRSIGTDLNPRALRTITNRSSKFYRPTRFTHFPHKSLQKTGFPRSYRTDYSAKGTTRHG